MIPRSRLQPQEAFPISDAESSEVLLSAVKSPEEMLSAEIAGKARLVERDWRPFFRAGLKLVNNIGQCNEKLKNAGRPELIVLSPVEVVDIKTPEAIILSGPIAAPEINIPEKYRYDNTTTLDKGNNYAGSLRIYGESGGITPEELEDLKTGEYTPPLTMLNPKAPAPSLERMLAIPDFTEFTKGVILDIGNGNFFRQKTIHAKRVFILFQLQRRLVDISDPGVIRDDGSIDKRVLNS